eukprot:GHVU01043502.1.p1 GENE.GHVU01043502.1~~GHVU01043502.1.p1  ORF type:complete len:107 (+),score=4.39 GHVU01043502.1:271-591(+)
MNPRCLYISQSIPPSTYSYIYTYMIYACARMGHVLVQLVVVDESPVSIAWAHDKSNYSSREGANGNPIDRADCGRGGAGLDRRAASRIMAASMAAAPIARNGMVTG